MNGQTRFYKLLPYVVFAYFVLCFVLHPQSPFFTHHLADPDDYMRLDQVAAWLEGQSWFDLSVHRLSPGASTIVHWSRLIDLPIAVLAWPFIASFGIASALLISSLIVPLLWFAILLVLLTALARDFAGPSYASLACVMVLFAPMLLFDYTPGRVDHHGVQAIIAGFGLLSLGKIIKSRNGSENANLYALLSAFAFACGFWIGAEALPWAILFIICLGIAAAWQGGAVARTAALFGAALPLFTALLIPAALPVSEFSSRALSWFSPAYVLFAALAGGILVFGWCLRCENKFLRLVFYALCATAAATAFLALVPSALHGPFADYDDFDATTALDNITEAQPLLHAFRFNRFMPVTLIVPMITFLRLLALPLAGLLTCLWAAGRVRDERRLTYLANALFLSVSIALTLFWQLRVGIYMELFALAPLTKLLCDGWEHFRWGLWDRRLFWAEIALFATLGPIPVLVLPALLSHASFYPDLILFAAARNAPACNLDSATSFLDTLKPQTIMNSSDTGPELLFAPQHNVVAGNFDVPGNTDAFAFFSATDDAQAEAAASKWNASLSLVCRTAPALYLGKDYTASAHLRLQAGKDGLLRFTNTDALQPLIMRLIKGEIPPWLKPIEIPGQSDYLLFQIQASTGKR
jgi:hypothetical protein